MAKKKNVEAEYTEDSVKDFTEEKEKIIAWVTGGNLNVRKDPSKEHTPVRVLSNGEEVEIVSIGEDWCKIKDGFVMRQYLKFE